MIITHIFADSFAEANSSLWQTHHPSSALRRAGHTVYTPHITQWMAGTIQCKRMVEESDIVLIQRVMVEEGLAQAKFWHDRGKSLAITCDDSYWRIGHGEESGNAASAFWHEGEVEVSYPGGGSFKKSLAKHPLQQFYEGIAAYCSGAIMPSRILRDELQWCLPCYYIPNYIDAPRYLKERNKRKADPDNLIVGWGGSMSHMNSFRKSGVAEALRRVFIQRKNVHFLLCGDKRIMNLLPLPKDRVTYQPYVTWSDWPKVFSKFDISLAPLAGIYDGSRSAIKMTEASIMGIPIVASASPPYKDYIESGVGLYPCNDDDDPKTQPARADAWEKSLLDIIDNYDYHKQKIDGQFDYAMKWDVDANVKRIVDVYQRVIDGRRQTDDGAVE